MRLCRTATIALIGATAFCAAAPAALADSSGETEASPHAVRAGHTVQLSTEDCRHALAAKVFVDIDGKRHWVWLNHRTSEGLTGWFRVPRDTDPGTYTVEGRCVYRTHEVEGTFVVKHRHDR